MLQINISREDDSSRVKNTRFMEGRRSDDSCDVIIF